MTTNNLILLGVTFAYAGIAIAAGFEQNWSKVVIFAGYTLANVGLIVAL